MLFFTHLLDGGLNHIIFLLLLFLLLFRCCSLNFVCFFFPNTSWYWFLVLKKIPSFYELVDTIDAMDIYRCFVTLVERLYSLLMYNGTFSRFLYGLYSPVDIFKLTLIFYKVWIYSDSEPVLFKKHFEIFSVTIITITLTFHYP